jgi:hypothetical protein
MLDARLVEFWKTWAESESMDRFELVEGLVKPLISRTMHKYELVRIMESYFEDLYEFTQAVKNGTVILDTKPTVITPIVKDVKRYLGGSSN